jgi:cysteine-rich repeat protein
MMNLRYGTMLVLIGGMLVSTTPADALDSSFGCASAKLKALGKTASSVFGCYSKLAKLGGGLGAIETAAPGCVQKAEDKWDLAPAGAFQKAETKAALTPSGCALEGQNTVLDGRCSGNPSRACLTNFDCAAVAAPPPPLPAEGVCNIHSDTTEAQALFDLVNDETIARPTHPNLNGLVQEILPDLIPNATANACNSAKVKTTGKLAAALLGCHSKAAKSGSTTLVDQACLSKAIAKHNLGYDKAEAKGALKPPQCDVVGNKDNVVTLVNGFAEKAVAGIPRKDGCGSGVVVAPETCDDGNTINTDACPSDCAIETCTPAPGTDKRWVLSFTSSKPVGSLSVFIDYPEDKVTLPGSGGSTPPGLLEFDQFNNSLGSNDFDHGLGANITTQVAADIGADPLAIHFEDCQVAGDPVPADFSCTVLGAADPTGKAVSGVTCSLSFQP